MNGYGALLRKECLESIRTYRLLIAAAVFLFAGISAPLLAHFLPDLIRNAKTSGMQIIVEKQTATDAMVNYAGNMAQMPALVVILLAMGAVAEERAHGFAALVLYRPVSRAAYVLAKTTAHAAVLGAALALGALGGLYYTMLLFSGTPVGPFLLVNLGVGVTMLDVLALTVLCSTVLRTGLAAGGASFALYLALSSLPNLWTPLRDSLPQTVPAHVTELVAGSWGGADLVRPLAGGLLLAALLIAAACLVLRRQEV